ncbi:MAG TPA: hypothetical protein V6D08_03505 [Candidatus Obscuribacterales bacterium]
MEFTLNAENSPVRAALQKTAREALHGWNELVKIAGAFLTVQGRLRKDGHWSTAYRRAIDAQSIEDAAQIVICRRCELATLMTLSLAFEKPWHDLVQKRDALLSAMKEAKETLKRGGIGRGLRLGLEHDLADALTVSEQLIKFGGNEVDPHVYAIQPRELRADAEKALTGAFEQLAALLPAVRRIDPSMDNLLESMTGLYTLRLDNVEDSVGKPYGLHEFTLVSAAARINDFAFNAGDLSAEYPASLAVARLIPEISSRVTDARREAHRFKTGARGFVCEKEYDRMTKLAEEGDIPPARYLEFIEGHNQARCRYERERGRLQYYVWLVEEKGAEAVSILPQAVAEAARLRDSANDTRLRPLALRAMANCLAAHAMIRHAVDDLHEAIWLVTDDLTGGKGRAALQARLESIDVCPKKAVHT